ncbi:MAG: SIR2 family protein, partial [Campylobacterales bacterium]|nr:SIR2 family protein [Campylobacterales bacterium]
RYLMECRSDKTELEKINSFIQKTKKFIFEKCVCSHEDVIKIYEQFYRKLVYRDKSLAKINIFTTNYDLFNERALDQLGIIFSNGFSGVIERYFNPAVFHYAFAEQMDLSNNKWNVIDNFIYLYKLHGSISWFEDEHSKHLFKIKELQAPAFTDKNVMIYPTPVKQNASFGSPYSDLFREFQKKLMLNNNILITVGYSFSDEHINNLIYQALTIPAFRLIIVGNVKAKNIEKLFELNDPRIWIIGETEDWSSGSLEKTPLHFFNRFVDEMLPSVDQENIEKSVQKVIESLLTKNEEVPSHDS